MALGNGARLGTYEVVGLLGAGGMGEVYRARDAKLKREVAIKVLPGTFAHDTGRVARLQREAEILASLNHPHIAAIYELVESGPSPFLVLELVDGETLADRLARGPLPYQEALTIARQIAEALEAAHDKGIVHRDLKPANIKITSGGNVKVLDFGLAKGPIADASLDPSHSPTMMATMPGAILGTAAYMAPEQAAGREADRGSDVWSFGCVLYEMLTGRRAFSGATASEILAEVLKGEPDWQRMPADTPGGIKRLLRRCLTKDRQQRPRDIRDVRLEIEDVRNAASTGSSEAAVRPARTERVMWASALALALLIASVLGVRALREPPAAPEVRLELNTPPTSALSLAVSPDGLKIAYAIKSAGRSQLWLRSLDAASARPLAGTDGGSMPFWSPDSRSIGFFAGTNLKRLDIDGGSVQTLAPGAVAIGGAWNSDGTIIFANNPGGPILRIPARGGEAVAATRLDAPRQRGHWFPQFLPDGRHFLFFVSGSPEGRGIYVGTLDGWETTRLFDADEAAVFASTGQILFIREGKLLAQDFDPDRLQLKGHPVTIAEQVNPGTKLSASAAGPIAYRSPAAASPQRQLVRVDRSGRELDKVIYPDDSVLGPALSHDGRRIAVYRHVSGNMDIYSYDMRARGWDRLTFDPGDDIFPLWSRDGGRIIFGGARGPSPIDLYQKILNGSPGGEEMLLKTAESKFPLDLSADMRVLLYESLSPAQGFDLWAVPLQGDRKPFEVVRTDFNEGLAQFSPDGKWIAYQSDKGGRYEVYLRPFPGPGDDVRASTDGGAQVRWHPNGKELFYVAADDRLMSVPISFPAGGGAVETGTPVPLFATNIGSTATNVYRQQYLVSPDGQSFVLNSAVEDGSPSPIVIILNRRPQRQ